MPHLPPIRLVTEWIADSTWLKKLKESLPFLIIFLSSTQLGLHFWPTSAFVYGVRVDYLSPTLYILDILIICYLLIKSKFENLRIYDLKFVVPLILTNLLFSQNPWASVSWSLHLVLYLAFILNLPQKSLSLIPPILFSSLLFQFLLSLAQVRLGHSLQGAFYYLGERMVAVGLPSVAISSFMGKVVLRTYGTFSHPNILAGFSVLSLLIITKTTGSKLLKFLTLVATVAIIVLTQSRTAALSLLFVIVPFYFLNSLRHRLLYSALLVSSIFCLLTSSPGSLLSRSLDLSVGERFSLGQISLKVISAYPIFGVGSSAAITRYPDLNSHFRLLQPDHNSFTLFLSWVGLVGILSFYFILKKFENLRIYDLRLIVSLLPLLLFDHYLLTSPQGLFLFLLLLRVNYLYEFSSQARRK